MARSHHAAKTADKIYKYRLYLEYPHFNEKCAIVMVHHKDDDTSRVMATGVPGFEYYYDNYPSVDGEEKQLRQELGQEVVELFEDKLSKYEPNKSSSKSNSGNTSLRDMYVDVAPGSVDEVISVMWKCMCLAESKYMEMMDELEGIESLEAENLEDKVLDVARPESADDI
jgi:hypothetical protein